MSLRSTWLVGSLAVAAVVASALWLLRVVCQPPRPNC
jgi:hypothetical protein